MAFLNVSLLKWAFVGFLALPAAEVICFLLVAAFIGWFRAGMLLVATSLLGITLLKRSGGRDLSRLADAIRRDGIGALHLNTPGVANVTGAVLLIIPGFLTDFLGAALMVPSWRGWFGRTWRKLPARATAPSTLRQANGTNSVTPTTRVPARSHRSDSGRTNPRGAARASCPLRARVLATRFHCGSSQSTSVARIS